MPRISCERDTTTTTTTILIITTTTILDPRSRRSRYLSSRHKDDL
jgi:hypothetical protein